MSKGAAHLLVDALKLPTVDRADLAAELIASLDGEPDTEVETAWATEIESRAARVRSGQAKARPWHEVRARRS